MGRRDGRRVVEPVANHEHLPACRGCRHDAVDLADRHHLCGMRHPELQGQRPGRVLGITRDDLGREPRIRELRDRLARIGAQPAPTTPEQFAALIQRELKKYGQVVKVSGAKVD